MKQQCVSNLPEDEFLLDRLQEQIYRFEQLLAKRFHSTEKESSLESGSGFPGDSISLSSLATQYNVMPCKK